MSPICNELRREFQRKLFVSVFVYSSIIPLDTFRPHIFVDRQTTNADGDPISPRPICCSSRHAPLLPPGPSITVTPIPHMHHDAGRVKRAQWSLTHDGCYSSKSAYNLITCPGIAQQFPHIP
jgi:hypothetical protein